MRTASGYVWKYQLLVLSIVLSISPAASRPARPRNEARPLAVTLNAPTLQHLGYEWRIEGDDDRNAAVAVRFREAKSSQWREGLPPLRLAGEDVVSRNFKGGFSYTAPNMFAGSVFDLRPDTEYEVRLTMSDPNGVSGARTRTFKARTRPIPRPAADGRVFHVYPFDHTGPKQEPSFKGLLGAYFENSVGGDWYNAFRPRVRAGDTILVHAGTYKDDRFRYGHELMSRFIECCNTTGDGTYYLTAKGTAERPIVIKAAGDGEVIFDGDDNAVLFNVMAADYNYFEGMTVRGTGVAFEAGLKDIAGAKGLTFKRMRFTDIGVGIHTDFGGSRDFYVADSVFIGRHAPDKLWSWGRGEWTKLPGYAQGSRLLSQFAVKVYGPGHVVAYNDIRNFHDGVTHATYGDPQGWPQTPADRMPSAIDFIGNDISNVHDNCIEADGGAQNIRVIANRCFNAGGQGFSLQPLLGGPAYFIRNILYNAPTAGSIKLFEQPAGGVFYHNSWFSNFASGPDAVASNIHLANNIIAQQMPSRPVLQLTTWTNYSSSNHNGFILDGAGPAFEWNSPDFAVPSDTQTPPIRRSYADLAAYSAATGQDRSSVMLPLASFKRLPALRLPSLNSLADRAALDLRLRDDSPAIDRGTRLPNINDGFAGQAPDLGAAELGSQPHFGPRPMGDER